MEQTRLFAPQEQRQVPPFHTGNRRLGASPRSSDSSHLEDCPRSMEPHMNGIGSLTSMTSISTGNFERLGDCQPMNASTSGVNSVRNQAPFVLLDWYESRDGPWDPLVGKNTPSSRHEDSRSRTGHMPLKNNGPAFQGYRGSAVPSECDTMHTGVLPSDSGYGSGPRPSIGNPSIYDEVDRSTETQSIIDPFSNFHVNNGDMWAHPAEAQSGVGTIEHDKDNLVCQYCKQKVKTKSELNKHRQRHTKPFVCTVDGCTRSHGFSTRNDLDRHVRSRHPGAVSAGNRYVCPLGTCKNRGKIWPRADNFRQHLKRVHKQEVAADDDLDQYLHKEMSACAEDLVGMGSSVAGYSIAPNPESHGLHSPSLLFDSRSGLSPPMRGFDDSYGSDYIGTSMPFQEHTDMGSGPQYSIMASSNTSDCLREQSLDSMPNMDLVFPDEEDLSDEHCVNETAPGPDAYIQPDVLAHNSMSAEKQAEEHSQLRNRDIEVFQKEDNKAPASSDEGTGSQETRSGNIATAGASSDATITVDDEDAPADELSADSPASTSGFKPEATEQKADVASQAKSVSVCTSEPMDLDDKDQAAAILNALQQKGLLAELVENLGYQMATKAQTTKSKKATTSPTPAQEMKSIVCTSSGCNKSFVRQCELKKHMKRHEKPYGCTYPSCSKKFGSKNDWKRHENSQHFQLEVWKCNERMRDHPTEICGKVCHRRETFKYHLQKDHSVKEPSTIEQKWEACRVGRNNETRFWCGFCKKIIENNQKGLEAWTERFNHIDDHFSGRNGDKMMISQWKAVDPDLPVMEISTPRSDEEGESPSPKPATPATSHHSPRDPREGSRSSKKRKSSEEHRSSKMRRTAAYEPGTGVLIWYCCKCQQQAGNIACTAACLENDCEQHVRCDDCRVEMI